MRPITTLAAALPAITSSPTGIQQSAPDRPNVVMIMTDDAGYADIGSYRAPGERQDWFARRQDVVQRLQQLLAEWERDVDAEAKAFAATRQ